MYIDERAEKEKKPNSSSPKTPERQRFREMYIIAFTDKETL